MSIVSVGNGAVNQLQQDAVVILSVNAANVTAVTYNGTAAPYSVIDGSTLHVDMPGNLATGTYNLVVSIGGTNYTKAVPYARTHDLAAVTGSYAPDSLWAQILLVGSVYFKVAPPPAGTTFNAPHTAWTTENAALPITEVITGTGTLSAEVLSSGGLATGRTYVANYTTGVNPYKATAKLTTVAADGRYPGLPFRVFAIKPAAQVAITDLAVTTADTTATLTFTPIQGATQYLYQRAIGTTWGGDTYASTATGTFQFTGLATGTTYSFRIFVDGVVSNVIVKATTGTGGTAPTGNTGTGTETTPGVALASQLTSIGTPGRIGSAVEPQWDIHMTAERLAVGTKAQGSSSEDMFAYHADETFISDNFSVKGTKSFQCNFIHARGYTENGGNPGTGDHQGYLHWGGLRNFPSDKYVYGGGFLHLQFSIYVEPSYTWNTQATYQKIMRVGGRKNATNGDGMGFITLLIAPDSSSNAMQVYLDNEVQSNALKELGATQYTITRPMIETFPNGHKFQKGSWNTFEFAIYPEPNGTRGILKVWKYDPSSGIMRRIFTDTNRQHVLVTKSGFYNKLFLLNTWNFIKYHYVGPGNGNYTRSGDNYTFVGNGLGDYVLRPSVAADQRIYIDEIKFHTQHSQMNEFDDLGEKVIGWAR